jgi:hypothetical protein
MLRFEPYQQDAADPWGVVMKFIVDVDFPPEPLNAYLRQHTAQGRSARCSTLSSPESSTFTDNGVG